MLVVGDLAIHRQRDSIYNNQKITRAVNYIGIIFGEDIGRNFNGDMLGKKSRKKNMNRNKKLKSTLKIEPLELRAI